jgi:hypothetical protein
MTKSVFAFALQKRSIGTKDMKSMLRQMNINIDIFEYYLWRFVWQFEYEVQKLEEFEWKQVPVKNIRYKHNFGKDPGVM